ncbi:MFS transporter [Akkermansia glycaniphila]|uniref:Proton-dependent oligopeptide transporter family n=1 Tax=Akkermansia glycaniphila TaxID=1679444 RepID=A0A1C7PCD7_9BACT|nr:MFS transporter [Akkermansia glycaniphila]MBT9449629.1 MFS transporter [Akkermansia glycaniphila]OCA03236.1 hypothetical protein AC781_06035 [Akkermansia glycaniphila]SEI01060.1 proton-dependent oligopeptide transporter family [Akkermansia glycaniphila]
MSALPPQTRYIIGNEACERFSYYGMRSILMIYMTQQLLLSEDNAKAIFHGFVALNYTMPLIGAWLADRFLGRYHTILFVSLFYCLGHGILATADMFESIEMHRIILYMGLAIIGMGSGGIKPCVSAFVGDQIRNQDSTLMTRAYAAFYWSINLGSFFSFLVIPAMRDSFGYGWAFGVPGIAMGLATFIFWIGRKRYHIVPPSRKKGGTGFFAVLKTACSSGWNKALALHGEEKVDNAHRMLKVLTVFAFIIPFWSLYEQTATSWVIQGKSMEPLYINLQWLVDGLVWKIGPEEFQSANPIFVMIFVPLLTLAIYPHVGKWGKPICRMGAGIILASVSFAIVAWLQYSLEQGATLSIIWQLIPYCVLTVAEVLVSTTGLEFAYTQAPASMKSITTSFWNLTICLGNLLVVALTCLFPGNAASTGMFLTYSGIALIVGILFLAVVGRMQHKYH